MNTEKLLEDDAKTNGFSNELVQTDYFGGSQPHRGCTDLGIRSQVGAWRRDLVISRVETGQGRQGGSRP